jgi:hypothetical protein
MRTVSRRRSLRWLVLSVFVTLGAVSIVVGPMSAGAQEARRGPKGKALNRQWSDLRAVVAEEDDKRFLLALSGFLEREYGVVPQTRIGNVVSLTRELDLVKDASAGTWSITRVPGVSPEKAPIRSIVKDGEIVTVMKDNVERGAVMGTPRGPGDVSVICLPKHIYLWWPDEGHMTVVTR